MKNKKIMILAPVLFVVCAIGILLIRESYSAPDDIMTVATAPIKQEKYYYIRRNMLSHHFITNNSDPSGTILIKTGSATATSGRRAIVYCAHKGKTIAKTSEGKYYKNVPIEQTSVAALKNAKSKLIGVMVNSYPYISLAELKEKIKKGIGETEYNNYKFDTLDVQEAMTATQAAIWNAIDGKINSTYSKTKKIGKIKYAYFHNTSNNSWALNWDKTSTYNITSGCYRGPACGSKSTYLAPGDTAASAGSYKANNATTLVGNRINRLINWYFTLDESTLASKNSAVPNFTVQAGSDTWTDEGSTLTVTILSNNDAFEYTPDVNYEIAFTDLAGKPLEISESSPVNSGSKTIGNKYVIKNITTKGVLATASASIPSTASNVYVYEANAAYKNTQYLIGVEDGDIPVVANLQILNEAKGKVYIYKTASKTAGSGEDVKAEVTYGSKKDNLCTAENPCQEGAEFVIYAQDKSTVLMEFESKKTPVELNLPLGTYYIQEVGAPVGFSMNEEMKEFKIDNESTIVAVHYNNLPTQICIKKVSTEDRQTTIDGATLQLQSMVGGVYEDFTTSSQEENGMYCTAPAQLPVGVYYIVETSAPANFIKSNVKYRIKVGNFTDDDISEEVDFDDGSTITDLELTTVDGIKNVAVIENKPGTVITKSDLATGGCVSGAHLVVKDSEGKQVDEWTSSCEAGKDSHEMELKEGTYTLVEETTPGGYATSESIEFTVDSKGKANTSLDMKDAPIEACFKKISKNNTDGLVGAEFEIYDEKGELYDTFTSQAAETCFQYMPVGRYTLKETKAPNGYQKLEKPIEIEVRDTGETQTFEINNEVNAPKTDVNASRLVIVIASIFMIFGLGLVGYYGYKKQS